MSFLEQKQKSTKKLIQTFEISQVAQTIITNTTTDTTTEINSSIMEISNGITNKEALKDKIHDIHNYLRNHGAGYGMNALKVFNILYGLKKIEDKGLHESVGLSDESRFSNLLNLANKNKDEEIATLIFHGVLDSISVSTIKELLFYEVPKNIKGSVFNHLIREIDKVAKIEVSCNVLLSGKIYEYFIGRDENAMRELGAYFTDRHIVDYIYDKLNPKMCENGTINSMIDMFGGSGGFTTGYINHLNLKYPELVEWETELNKIYHYDMNEDVIKSAGLEFFCLTGVLPKMSNLKYKNSFTDEFIDESTNATRKYHYVMTNPPYGGDKIKKTESQKKNEKIKVYIKKELPSILDGDVKKKRQEQLKRIELIEKQEKHDNDKSKVSIKMCSGRIQRFAKDNCLTGTDKEACSLMLMMDLLEVGGTSIGVLKEGVFFDGSYKNLRKCLIENFNVREVISVPKDQFENTQVNTSIVIFDNIEAKTSEVKFIELLVNKHKKDVFDEINGEIFIVENKGDIKEVVEKPVSVASVEKLLKNHKCSLNGMDYKLQTQNVSTTYTFNNLIDLCNIRLGTRITKRENEVGEIPVYGGGDITFYTNNSNREQNTLIISRYALSKVCVRLLRNKFYLNDSGLSIHSKDADLQTYINYVLLNDDIQRTIYTDCTTGSIQRNLNMEAFHNLKIPVPKSSVKIQEWVDKISKPYDEKNEKQSKVKQLEIDIQNRIQGITENEECVEVGFNDLCLTKKGKPLCKENFIIGIYPVIGGGISPTGYHNDYNMEFNTILCSSSGNNAGYISKYNSRVWASDCFSIHSKNINVSNSYMYYLLRYKQNDIFELQKGSAQPHIYSNDLVNNITFRIPKDKQLMTDMDSMFQEIEILQTDIKNADELYKLYIQELGNEAKQCNILAFNEEPIVVINEPVQEPIIKIRIIRRKKAV